MYSHRRVRPETTQPRKSVAALRESLKRTIENAERLGVSHRDPEAFHVQKSEIVRDLRRLERDLAQAL